MAKINSDTGFEVAVSATVQSHMAKELTDEEERRMREQNSRLVSEHRAAQLEREAKKHWDLFYKRNETRFFKDRHWTTREFEELLSLGGADGVLLEVGCGVGNLFYPLLEDGLKIKRVYACDISPRAVDLVKVSSFFFFFSFFLDLWNQFYNFLSKYVFRFTILPES